MLVEINHRFNKDTELLATMLPFDEEAWQDCIPIVAAQLGFDRGRLCDEGKNVKRHCENHKALSDRKMGKNFWMRFLSDSYTRAMYPEHCRLQQCYSRCLWEVAPLRGVFHTRPGLHVIADLHSLATIYHHWSALVNRVLLFLQSLR